MPQEVILTREQVRRVDQLAISRYGMSGLVLMENAGRNAANWLMELGIAGPVLMACGRGNNAGDGFVIARHLLNFGREVRVWLCAGDESLSPDANANLQILRRVGVDIARLNDAASPPAEWSRDLAASDWIVDALLGTGTRGELREPFPAVIQAINAARRMGKKVLAVDLPSGFDSDFGEPGSACIEATHTATFVGKKTGFVHPDADRFTGEVKVLDIGVPWCVIEESLHPAS